MDHLTRLFLGCSTLYRLVSFCEVIREATGYRVEMLSFPDAVRAFKIAKFCNMVSSLTQILNAVFDYAIKQTNGMYYVLWFPVEDSKFCASR